MSITPENKHAMLRKVATSTKLSPEEIRSFVEAQLENDENKDLAKRCRISCDAAIYDPAVKEKYWNMITADKLELSVYDQQAVMRTLLPLNQVDIVRPYIDKFFEVVPKIYKTRERDGRDPFFFFISPSKFATEELLEKYRALLDHKDATRSLKQKVNEEIERIEKYLEGKKLYLATIQLEKSQSKL